MDNEYENVSDEHKKILIEALYVLVEKRMKEYDTKIDKKGYEKFHRNMDEIYDIIYNIDKREEENWI